MNTILTFFTDRGIMDNQHVTVEPEPKSFALRLDLKKVLIGLGIAALCLAIAATAFLTYRNQTTSQSIATRASENKDTVNLILELEKDKNTGEVRVLKAIANDGYATKQTQSPEADEDATDFIVDESDKVVAPVQFSDHFIAETQTHLDGVGSADPRVMHGNPKAYISIPYTQGKSLFVASKENLNNRSKGLQKKQLDNTSISLAILNIEKVNKTPQTTELLNGQATSGNRGPTNNTLDILFISSNYTDMAQFRADADGMANFLLTKQPFAEFSQSIRFLKLENTQATNCTYVPDAVRCPDIARVQQIASQVPHHQIAVIYNCNDDSGAAYYDANMLVLCGDFRDAVEDQIFVHELGHSFGKLADEYSYGIPHTGQSLRRNCDVSGCDRWNNVPGAGCFQECTYSNAYRAYQNNTIMRDMNGGFGNVAEPIVRNKLLQQGLLPNQGPSPTPSPTATPTPLPNRITSFGSSVYTDNIQRQFAVKGGKIYRRLESNWDLWEDITYFVNPPTQVGTGEITGFSVEVYQDNLQRQFLVRGGEIHRRTQRTNGSFGNWENITYFVNPPSESQIGSGLITAFSVGVYQNNLQHHFLTRNGRVYRRIEPNWNTWEDITNTFSSVGQGTITAFSSTVYQDNKQRQFVVKGNRVYRRIEPNWNTWEDITSLFDPLGQ